MKKIILVFASFLAITTSAQKNNDEKTAIDQLLNNWHKAAADAHYDEYFSVMADNSIYIGTDATENWTKKEFMIWAKPHFNRGKAWDFKTLQRNIYFSANKKLVWFDELLNTQMKICRGSGVLEKVKGEWKLKHYVLSMTIPNDNVDEVIKTKQTIEDKLIEELGNSGN
ncbi:hypothetical protein GV828_07275 [Flavobacterium sp. NST-5]|uniref:SnoaL-like domain-containing protein n=1 Tax=Flavobacterium ichthyis TaxID=2698827 RepID=A0ABW9Z812_9FLAO|nr:nuclear transport factor 2 family protein [Flavobacterium ichthyis]NBL64998.1 hypothetical protein [Flavobacterium ichthyis]